CPARAPVRSRSRLTTANDDGPAGLSTRTNPVGLSARGGISRPWAPELLPSEARLRRRLAPLAAGCRARDACPYSGYCPARRPLASFASNAPGAREAHARERTDAWAANSARRKAVISS